MEKKCLNCDFPILPEHKYCPSCSQRTSERVTLRSLFANSISSYLSINSRLLHTLLPLLIKPGKVAKEFIAGKRKTYLYPVQSYLFFSLLFLLVFELLPNKSEFININTNDDVSLNLNTDSLLAEIDTSGKLQQINNPLEVFVYTLDSLKKAGTSVEDAIVFLTADDSGIIHFMKSQAIKITYKGGQNFLTAALGNTPFTLLFFLPFLALLQYLFGNKKKWNIASHFVFHLYNLSFAFIILLVLYVIDHFTGKNAILFAFGIIPIYLFMALFRFYGSRVWRNILRFTLLTFFSIVIGFPIITLGTFVITFLRY